MSSFLTTVANLASVIENNIYKVSDLNISLVPRINGVNIYVHTTTTVGFNSMKIVLKQSESIEFLIPVPSSDGKTLAVANNWSITEGTKTIIYENSDLESALTNLRTYKFSFDFNEAFSVDKIDNLLFSIVNTESVNSLNWTLNSSVFFLRSDVTASWGEVDSNGNREIILSGNVNINGFEIYITKNGGASGFTNAELTVPSDWLIAAGPNGVTGAGITSQVSQNYTIRVGPIESGSTYEIVNIMQSGIHSHGENRLSVALSDTGTLIPIYPE